MSEAPITRNTERTKRAILDAAIDVLLKKSAAMTIADVSCAAGVSKSGLLHHYPSRDDLLLAVLVDVQMRMRAEVQANLDLSENQPGKTLRAYIRTVCSDESEIANLLNALPFWTGLEGVAGARELDTEDQQWWWEQLLADGLDENLVRIIRRAAEGVAAAYSYGDEDSASLRQTGRSLIQLTFQQEAVLPLFQEPN